jgi:type 1 glutamine amidotransferase
MQPMHLDPSMRPATTRSTVIARIAAVAAVIAVAFAAASGAEAMQSPPAAATPAPAQVPAADASALPRILVFSRTAAFRHASIPDGIRAVTELGAGRWTVDATEDSSVFTAANLKNYRAVVFLSTTGDVLDDAQQKAFEQYIHAGGAWVGVHAATDTEYDWPWYGQLAGARFAGHPAVNQEATVVVEDRTHRSTRMLPAEWKRLDEWYAFHSNPRSKVHVLASLDEKSYDPGKASMGGDHPIMWCHDFEGGRAWYTAGGHTKESYTEPLFRQHLREGIEWAAGIAEGKAGLPAAPAKAPKPTAQLMQSTRAHSLLADASPMLAAIPTSLALGGAFLVAAIILGATGQGIKGPVLNWAFPGLGHVVLGHRKRGFLAMAAILGMFGCGLLVGGIDAVDSVEDAPWFIAQSGNGPIALATDWANQNILKTGKVGELLPAPAPLDPLGRPLPGKHTMSSFKGLGSANEFGTLFIALGGLMNFILVMDISRRD